MGRVNFDFVEECMYLLYCRKYVYFLRISGQYTAPRISGQYTSSKTSIMGANRGYRTFGWINFLHPLQYPSPLGIKPKRAVISIRVAITPQDICTDTCLIFAISGCPQDKGNTRLSSSSAFSEVQELIGSLNP